MRIVILAAGMGTRLGAESPKPLSLIDDSHTLLGNQIDLFSRFVPSPRIRIVAGYRDNEIRSAFPDCHHIHNPAFERSNTATSLLRGIEDLDNTAPLLWANADLYFELEALERMIALGTDQAGALVLPGRIDSEAIKYRLGSSGCIEGLAKDLSDACGEAVGLIMIPGASVPDLIRELRRCDAGDFFEAAISNMIDRGRLELHAVTPGDSYCREVDFPEDLEAVRHHIARGAS